MITQPTLHRRRIRARLLTAVPVVTAVGAAVMGAVGAAEVINMSAAMTFFAIAIIIYIIVTR